MKLTEPVTYLLDLDVLDEKSAVFRHFIGVEGETPSGVVVELPREHWVDLGRPGRISVAPWRVEEP